MSLDHVKNLRTENEELAHKLSSTLEPSEIKRLNRRHLELTRIIEKADQIEKLKKELEQNNEMLASENAEDMKALFEDEISKAEEQIPLLEAELQKLLIPRDPADQSDAILEIRAGTGGDEATFFASELMRMYTRYAERKGWKVLIDHMSKSELGGIKEAIIEIKGEGVYGELKYEAGVHRVQRVPETEKSGRIHTSTASVAALPLLAEEEFHLDPKELKIEATTSSGNGGQSVNTTYSAIRILHIPTGITAQCQDERSQTQNKAKAMNVIRARVAAHYTEIKDRELRDTRRSQIKGAERSDKIRTYNFPQDRITDHRLNENFHQMETRLDGGIEDIVSQLTDLDTKERLEALEEGRINS